MEKRQHRRIPFQREVYMANRHGEEQKLRASDFSLTGMGVVSETPVLIGQKVWLRFTVNTLGKSRELSVSGEIRHVDMVDNGYVFGVSFLNEEPELLYQNAGSRA